MAQAPDLRANGLNLNWSELPRCLLVEKIMFFQANALIRKSSIGSIACKEGRDFRHWASIEDKVKVREVIAEPYAAALVEGHRDFGCNLQTALADVIDNAITAGASQVDLIADTVSNEPLVAVADNARARADKRKFSLHVEEARQIEAAEKEIGKGPLAILPTLPDTPRTGFVGNAEKAAKPLPVPERDDRGPVADGVTERDNPPHDTMSGPNCQNDR